MSEVLEAADVVFVNGLELEEPTLALARDVADDAVIVELGDRIVSPDEYLYDFSFPEEEGKPNPHLWTDPTLAKGYARYIAETMAEVDPDHAEEYEANRAAFADRVDDFDAALRTALETVPEENRKLLTYHDAYAYFAKTYGWEVIGAVQPEDFDDPTPKEVADLVDQIRPRACRRSSGPRSSRHPSWRPIAEEAVPIRGRPARRRPARRARRRRALLDGADARRLRHDGRGARGPGRRPRGLRRRRGWPRTPRSTRSEPAIASRQ